MYPYPKSDDGIRPTAVKRALRLGVTGGIGAGKTFVCSELRRRGVPVLDTDETAHRLMASDAPLRTSLERLIGKPVTAPDGNLLKPAISQYMAASPLNVERINNLVHPCVRRAVARWIADRTEEVVAVECALIFEAGWQDDFDKILLVEAPRQVRIDRVMKRSHKQATDVGRWISLQLDDERKRSLADFVITNDGTADIRARIDTLLQQLR